MKGFKVPKISENDRLKRFEMYNNEDLIYILTYRSLEDKITYDIGENATRSSLLEAVMSSWDAKLVPPRNGSSMRYDEENNLDINRRYVGPYYETSLYRIGFFLNEMIDINITSFWSNPQFKQIILGSYDKNSPLKKLCGNKDILTKIFTMALKDYSLNIIYEPIHKQIITYLQITFPKPTGIKINMMPFYLYKKETLPVEYHDYWNIIKGCICRDATEGTDRNNIKAYLTIEEGFVETGKTQRRPGLHIDSTRSFCNKSTNKTYFWHWGGGCVGSDNKFHGGIYLASNIDDSCAIYPCVLTNPHEISMDGGNIENLRGLVGDPIYTKKNELYWITDCVPHEAIPMKANVHRQFFRLVVGEISVWYSQHSTPNPLGTLPTATIIDTNKFEK